MKLCNERQHKIHFGLFIIVKELILENKKHIRSALQLSVHSFSTVSVPLLKRDANCFPRDHMQKKASQVDVVKNCLMAHLINACVWIYGVSRRATGLKGSSMICILLLLRQAAEFTIIPFA